MLTWAITTLMLKDKTDNGFWMIIAMGCDVAIFYWIAQAFIHGR